MAFHGTLAMMFSGFANLENDEPFEILILSHIYKFEKSSSCRPAKKVTFVAKELSKH